MKKILIAVLAMCISACEMGRDEVEVTDANGINVKFGALIESHAISIKACENHKGVKRAVVYDENEFVTRFTHNEYMVTNIVCNDSSKAIYYKPIRMVK